jgi:hypothetical protein
MLKNSILKIELGKFFKIIYICTKCPILQNGLHVDEIFIYFLKKLNIALKNTYVLSNYECYNHNILNF